MGSTRGAVLAYSFVTGGRCGGGPGKPPRLLPVKGGPVTRHKPLPNTWWWGKAPRFSTASQAVNSDGTAALSRSELAERLLAQRAGRAPAGDRRTSSSSASG